MPKPPLLIAIYHNADYYPPTFNAAAILSKYFDVHLICRNVDKPFREWPDGVTIDRIGGIGSQHDKASAGAIAKIVEYRSFIGAIRAAIRDLSPRLIYAYEPHAFVAALCAGAERHAIPIFYHLHELPDRKERSVASLHRWVESLALKMARDADAIIFPEGNRAQRYLAAAGDSRPALIVPNCPSRDFCPGDFDWDAVVAERFERPEIFYMGGIGAANGNTESVRALASLPDTFSLAMVGSAAPEFYGCLTALARELGVEERLSLPGWIPYRELADRAVRASVGIALYQPVSKNYEYCASASNKIFEYAACGLPVVVPDRRSHREFLAGESWALFTDAGNPAAIAATIRALFSDRAEYRAKCIAARRFYLERYHYERVFAPVLERMLDRVGAHRGANVAFD